MSNQGIHPWNVVPCRHCDGYKMYMEYFAASNKYRFQGRVRNLWYVTWIDGDWTKKEAQTQAAIDFLMVSAGKPGHAEMSDDRPDYEPLP